MKLSRRQFLGATTAAWAACTPSRGRAPTALTGPARPRRVLWAANVRTKSLPERLEAARAGRFDAMSVFPIDHRAWRAQMSAAEIRRRFNDAGVTPAIVDPFVQWVPGFEIPAGYPPENVPFIDHSEADILRTASELGAKQINCVEGLDKVYPQALLVDALGAFVDRAAAEGLEVTLEPMPISSVATLKDGWDLVRAVDRPTFRITFDTWHFHRAEPDHGLLATIPGERIGEVQLADGGAGLQGTLLNDLLHHRALPGRGAFALHRTMSVLAQIGALRSVGPELFSDQMDALSGAEVGRVTAEALDRFIAATRG